MRRAVVVLAITVVAVVALVSYRTHLPRRAPPRPRALARPAARAQPRGTARPAARAQPPGTRAATGVAISTPFTTIQVRAFVRRGRVIDVDAGDEVIVPILHAEALRAGSARIDTVSGATGTSTSYISSLQSAIDRARG